MAAELVGGALLSAFLQVAFDRLASPKVVDFFRGRKLDEKLLGKLHITLHSINSLADDAEQKQFRDPYVKAWLLAVNDAVFDAEVLLDEIDYELIKCNVEAESAPQSLTSKVSNFFDSTFRSFNKKINSGMREVTEKLEYLAKQKGALGLKKCSYSGDGPDTKFKFLRVLSLSGYVDLITEVPDSVSALKHLRSLDLSYTDIQKLPDSICLLFNLLILKLNGCLYLEELPSNIHKLTKLQCLEFEDTKVTKMPMHFGELKNLHLLDAFRVHSESSIKQLGGLNLHGSLSIYQVQNIVNPLDALEANLKDKHLVELGLIWNSNHVPNDAREEKEVLENLQPSIHLEHLSIWSYHVSIGVSDGFYGSNSSSFASMERLSFRNMKEWEEWECKTTSFPRLQYLFVDQCCKLKGLPEQLIHLKNIFIGGCDELTISVNNMDTSSLQFLNINSCPRVNIPITAFNSLEVMRITHGCPSLIIFPLDFFPKLRTLLLFHCQNLQRISQEETHNHLKELQYVALNLSHFPVKDYLHGGYKKSKLKQRQI
ncbi:leucine-rich repeat-containing protein [Vigna unguiculata]|uniref:Leucine-rich repeat-containing protein n=1 Tax=Vigna unguiculata TaxID=3917 RepID=A0A4D6M3C9_VIGUN|nr:leucine-rich repeat-containing protein [Vigna unguiculata]